MSSSSAPAGGWYPDPEQPDQLRWWDGAAWTSHTQAVGALDASPVLVVPATVVAPALPLKPYVRPPLSTSPRKVGRSVKLLIGVLLGVLAVSIIIHVFFYTSLPLWATVHLLIIVLGPPIVMASAPFKIVFRLLKKQTTRPSAGTIVGAIFGALGAAVWVALLLSFIVNPPIGDSCSTCSAKASIRSVADEIEACAVLQGDAYINGTNRCDAAYVARQPGSDTGGPTFAKLINDNNVKVNLTPTGGYKVSSTISKKEYTVTFTYGREGGPPSKTCAPISTRVCPPTGTW